MACIAHSQIVLVSSHILSSMGAILNFFCGMHSFLILFLSLLPLIHLVILISTKTHFFTDNVSILIGWPCTGLLLQQLNVNAIRFVYCQEAIQSVQQLFFAFPPSQLKMLLWVICHLSLCNLIDTDQYLHAFKRAKGEGYFLNPKSDRKVGFFTQDKLILKWKRNHQSLHIFGERICSFKHFIQVAVYGVLWNVL